MTDSVRLGEMCKIFLKNAKILPDHYHNNTVILYYYYFTIMYVHYVINYVTIM